MAQMIDKEATQFSLGCASAVVEEEGDQGGKIQLSGASECGISKPVFLDKTGI